MGNSRHWVIKYFTHNNNEINKYQINRTKWAKSIIHPICLDSLQIRFVFWENPSSGIFQQFIFLFQCFYSLVHLNRLSDVLFLSSLSHPMRDLQKKANKQADVMPGNITDISCGTDLRLGCFLFFNPFHFLFSNAYSPWSQTGTQEKQGCYSNMIASAVFSFHSQT